MPRASVWLIRSALVYLFLGFTFGALLLIHKGTGWIPAAWIFLPAHMEFLLTGWMLQLAAGMAYWILPRFGRGEPRGNPRLPWPVFLLFNAGILLVVLRPFMGPGWLMLAGRVLELAGAILFLFVVWRRVKPFAT